MTAEAARSLMRLIPSDRILYGAVDLQHYGGDWTWSRQPAPSAVVLPESSAEVQAVVHWARANRVALVPSGDVQGLVAAR